MYYLLMRRVPTATIKIRIAPPTIIPARIPSIKAK